MKSRLRNRRDKRFKQRILARVGTLEEDGVKLTHVVYEERWSGSYWKLYRHVQIPGISREISGLVQSFFIGDQDIVARTIT